VVVVIVVLAMALDRRWTGGYRVEGLYIYNCDKRGKKETNKTKKDSKKTRR
jgi:hypothetical protein